MFTAATHLRNTMNARRFFMTTLFRQVFLRALSCFIIFLLICELFRRISTCESVKSDIQQSAFTKLDEAVVWNTCTMQASRCTLNGAFAYIFYISNVAGSVKGAGLSTSDKNSTYFEYAKRAIKRTAALTRFPIILLCTSESFRGCSQIIATISPYPGQIDLIEVDATLWLQPYFEYKVKQKRSKLMHAYGTTQVFNPAYVSKYERLIYMDVDTFLIRNVDELFCTEGFAAAKRQSVPLFNGGVFVYSPSRYIYDKMMSNMIQYMKKPGEKKFAMQALLHELFGQTYYCIEPTYNCGGFCGVQEKCSKISPKCGIKDESELFVKGAIIHSKINEPHLQETFPNLHFLWLTYG